jgi:hypothetical protein
MIALLIVTVIVVGVVCCIGLHCYFQYKPKQLEYQKEKEAHLSDVGLKTMELEIERELTKQMELDKDAFKEKEKTKQYEIKERYGDKHNSSLY